MKILIVDVNCNYSSTGKIAYYKFNRLKELGHEVKLCYGRGLKSNEVDIHKISSNIEVLFHAFMARITGLNGYFSFFSTKKLINIVKEFNPDLIHIHDPKTYYLNIFSFLKYIKKKQITIVWTFHSEYMYTGKCGHSFDCEKWKTECYNCPQLRDYPKSMFFDFTSKMYRDKKNAFDRLDKLVIVTPSDWLKNRVMKSFLKNKKIITINNGIDNHKLFIPQINMHNNILFDDVKEEHIVLSVAPKLMSDLKGGKWVLEVAKRMPNIRFVLIGVDENLNDYDNVTFLKKINDQELLSRYYSRADVFLICSKRENYPTTCLESLSCGTPIVGFDVGGTRETTDSHTGYFVKYGDVEGLVKGINSFIELDLKSKKMISQQCMDYSKANHSLNTMVEKYENLYKELLYANKKR